MIRTKATLLVVVAFCGAVSSARAQATMLEREPNDTSITATLVPLGGDVKGAIDHPGDIDYFAVDLEAGTELEFYLYPNTATLYNPTQWLIDPDGRTIINKIDWISTLHLIRHVVPRSGRYFLRIGDYEGRGGPEYTYVIKLRRYVRPPFGPGDPVSVLLSFDRDSIGSYGIAAAPSGDLVTGSYPEPVRISTDGKITRMSLGVTGFPIFDGWGNLLLLSCTGTPECGRTVVWRISPTGERTVFFEGPGVVRTMTIAPNGDVWMYADYDGGLWRFDPDGVFKDSVRFNALLAGPFAGGMAFSPAGEFFYSGAYGVAHDSATCALFKLVDNQPQPAIKAAPGDCFHDFVFDQNGNIYVVAVRGTSEIWSRSERILLYDSQYRLVEDPFAEVDDNFAEFSIGPLAFARDANGAMTNRLVVIHNGHLTFPPYPGQSEIVALNRDAVRFPGARIGVDLSAVVLDKQQAGAVGVSYSNSLHMVGAQEGIRWRVESGALPPGVTLNEATGVLSGTPGDAGSFTFSVRPKSDSRVGFGRFTISIAPPQFTVDEVVNALLTGGTISSTVVQFLDHHGNNNGVLDVGDLRAYLRTQGELP